MTLCYNGKKVPRRRLQSSRGVADLRKQANMPHPTCSFPECGRPCITARIEHCTGHYAQAQKGQPLRPIYRTPEGRFWSKVRKTGTCWVWEGSKSQRGYGSFYFQGKVRTAHRVSWEFANGKIDPDLVLDHICHNTSCVRPSHLRPVTQGENMQHRLGARVDSRSGVRGVVFRRGQYHVNVYVGGSRFGGKHATLEAAEAEARALRREHMPYSDMDRLQLDA